MAIPKFLRTGRMPSQPAFQFIKPPTTPEARALVEAFRKAHPELQKWTDTDFSEIERRAMAHMEKPRG